jgi:hypothetical protein
MAFLFDFLSPGKYFYFVTTPTTTTVDLGYNVMQGSEYFAEISEELIGATLLYRRGVV